MKSPLVTIILVVVLVAAAVLVTALTMSRRQPDAPSSAPDDAPWAVTAATPALAADEFQTLPGAERTILVHCGTSMRPATEVIAAEFQRKTGIGVHFNFGGSAELLPSIELGREGDLYICHDPYAQLLTEKDLLIEYRTVGYLEPVIIVPTGNPHGIASLADLARPGLQLGRPDARFATCGRLLDEELDRQGITEAFQANVVLDARGHNTVALALVSGNVDAAVVWSFIPSFYRGRLETAESGVTWPEIRVTMCLLKSTADRAAAEQFMKLAASPFGREVFAEHGYAKSH